MTGWVVTFLNSRGCNLIDYLLCRSDLINKTTICFDHSPISFIIKCLGHAVTDSSEKNTTGRIECKSVRWVEENTPAIIDSIKMNYEELRRYISTQISARSDININTMVKTFCESLNNYVLSTIL